MEHDGILKSIGKGLYENKEGIDNNYLINEFTNGGNGLYVDLSDVVSYLDCNQKVCFLY